MSQAIGQSEEEASIIEKQMLQDKMSATDWEATNEAIEQQIAQESYLEWLKQSEKANVRFAFRDRTRDTNLSQHYVKSV